MTFELARVQQALTGSVALSAIVGSRISQLIAPEDQSRPYVVWFVVSNVPENTLSCAPDVDDQRIQIDLYSPDQVQARQMMQAAVEAVNDLGYIVFGPWAAFEDLPKLYRWSFALEVWQNRSP
jgi:NAD(P)H-dependent FMN reductase